MDATQMARIRQNPAFQELERKRGVLSWSLAILMLVIYGAFIFLVAFDHSLAATPIGDGPLTLAFPLGLGVIVVAIVLTGVYVVRANSAFDRLTDEVVGQTRAGPAPVSGRLAEGVR